MSKIGQVVEKCARTAVDNRVKRSKHNGFVSLLISILSIIIFLNFVSFPIFNLLRVDPAILRLWLYRSEKER